MPTNPRQRGLVERLRDGAYRVSAHRSGMWRNAGGMWLMIEPEATADDRLNKE